MSSIKNYLIFSAKQRRLCERLEAARGRLLRMAYAWSNNPEVADEVVQKTMATVQKTVINAINNVDKLHDAGALDSWLFRILSNCFIDMHAKQREKIGAEKELLFEPDIPETVHNKNEMLASIRYAMARLPFRHRQVITLVDIESFSYAEVADILDVPMGTIMSRLNRARQLLKQTLDESKINNNKANLKIVS